MVRALRFGAVTFILPFMVSLVDVGCRVKTWRLGFDRLVFGVIERAVAQKSIELRRSLFFFVDVTLVPFVQSVELFCENSPVQVDRVLVLGLRHILFVVIAVIRELVNVMLVVVRIAASIVARGMFFLLRCCNFLCFLVRLVVLR